MCECGYTREQHLEEALRPHAFQDDKWDPKKHIQEVPTDAFGNIAFTGLGQKVGKVSFHHPLLLARTRAHRCWPATAGPPGLGGGLAVAWGRGPPSLKDGAAEPPGLAGDTHPRVLCCHRAGWGWMAFCPGVKGARECTGQVPPQWQ